MPGRRLAWSLFGCLTNCLGDCVDAPAQKICTICGLDCSNKPRTKDAQGRYVCKECMQRAQSAQLAKQDAANPKAPTGPAPVAAASDQGDNAFLLDIVEAPKVREGQKPCPSCGKGVNEGQILCTSCGFNMKTGERALINVLKPVEIRDKSERNRSGGGGGINIPEWAPGVIPTILIVGVFLAGYQTENPMLMAIAFICAGVFALVTFVTGIVTAFREGDSTAGIIMICSPLCGFLGLYTLYWVYAKCDSGVLKWMYGCMLLLGISMQIIAMTMPDLLEGA